MSNNALETTASEFHARGSSILLGDLNSELSTNGFNGLQSRIEKLAAMKDLPLQAASPSDPGCVELLSNMAVQINTAIEQNSLSTFNVGIDCFTKVLNFICQGIPDLFLLQQAKASDIAPIRAMYLQVFLRVPVSLWPDYLYIFGRAYSSVSSLWTTWLREEAGINPEKEQIHQIFGQYLTAGKICNVLAHRELLHERDMFLIQAMAEDILRQFTMTICEIVITALAPKASAGYTIYKEG